MRVPQSYIQKCKVAAHVFQILFTFIGACIAIAVLTKDGTTGGGTKFFLALCFLTVPALIYLVMVPMWSRASRFANAYAFLSLDALYTIMYFASFIAIAMWNADGIRQGAEDKKLDSNAGNCSTFKYGPEDKCKLSRATVGFGIVIFIFFAITTGISAYYLIKFRKDGIMPYESKSVNPHHIGGDNSASKDNAWSTEIEAQDSDDDDRHTERGGNQEEDEYALLHSTETDEGRHPGRPLSWGDDRFGREPAPPYAGYREEANALSPGGYEDYRRDAGANPMSPGGYEDYRREAVAGNTGGYGNHGGQGYSFSGGDRH